MQEVALTNLEVKLMFGNMIRDWFSQNEADYNDFVRALLLGDVKAMNAYMNRVSLGIFSYFDTGNRPSGEEPKNPTSGAEPPDTRHRNDSKGIPCNCFA